jgi:N-acetyl-gamma-glutamyl-phosphate reductase
MNSRIKVGIIGGAGYTGGELLRILVHHPQAELVFVHSRSNAGRPLADVHPDLAGETDLSFAAEKHDAIDALFLCVGHGEAGKYLAENEVPGSTRIIDLSQDFRLAGKAPVHGREFVYGLPELNRQRIRTAANIANPGCFATAIQLGLLPLAKAGLLGDVYSTGITGSTGAGQSLHTTAHFSWRANNIQAYKTLNHQHLHEIYQSVHQLQPGFPARPFGAGGPAGIHFVPWRGDFTRGIFISSTVRCGLSLADARALFGSYYAGHPFTLLSEAPLFLKQVVNTNKCVIHLEQQGDHLVVHSAIDNLLKGASGQAVQNMNLMFGADESAGLRLKANYF